MPKIKGLPELSFEMSCSAGLYDLLRGNRLWNRYGREAMEEELIKHHQTRIPRHFRIGAAAIYGYAPRKGSTKLAKVRVYRLPANLDLVKTKTMSLSVMRTRSITMSGRIGAGGGGNLQGRLTMPLGHPLRRGRKADAITPEQIKREIVSMTPQEKLDFAHGFRDRLATKIRQHHANMRRFRAGN